MPHTGQSWALRSLDNFAVSRLRLAGSGLADYGDRSQEAYHCSTDRRVRNDPYVAIPGGASAYQLRSLVHVSRTAGFGRPKEAGEWLELVG